MDPDSQKASSSAKNSDDFQGVFFSAKNSAAGETETVTKVDAHQPVINNLKNQDLFSKDFSADSLERGAIVTDRVGNRRTLSQSLQRAFTEWWFGAKKTFEKTLDSTNSFIATDEIPIQTIAKAETRAEIIKEASVYTAQVPKNDDLNILIEKTPTPMMDNLIKLKPVRIIAKDSPEIQKQSAWSHVLMEPLKSDPTPVPTTVVSSATPTYIDALSKNSWTIKQKNSENESMAAQINNLSSATPSKNFSTVPQTPVQGVLPRNELEKNVSHINLAAVSPTTIPPKPIPQKEKSEKYTAKDTIQQNITVSSPTYTPLTEKSAPLHSVSEISVFEQKIPESFIAQTSVSQNNVRQLIRKLLTALGIILFGAGCVLFVNIYLHLPKKDSGPVTVLTPVTPVTVQKILETDSETQFPLPSNKISFLTELTAKTNSATQKISQFYPVRTIGETRQGASSEEILRVLEVHLNPQTIRALENTLVFGSVTTSKNEPFIVLQSLNFDVLFSGMLLWEPNLQHDFDPLFGTALPVQKFTDGIIGNKPTRFLLDETGKIQLLYSFVNQTTVVITTSREALLLLLERF